MSKGSESACCSRGHVHSLRTVAMKSFASLSPKAFPAVRGHGTAPANTLFLGIFIIKIMDSEANPEEVEALQFRTQRLCVVSLRDSIPSLTQ